MANIATIYVKLGLNAKEYHDGLNSATQTTKNFGGTMGGIMNGIGKVAMVGLGAIAGHAHAFGFGDCPQHATVGAIGES